jgi:formylglycine-generating enzyme required for sulfatase activity
MAGEVLLEMRVGKAVKTRAGQVAICRMRTLLAGLIENREQAIPFKELAKAAVVLGQLIDPRPGVGLKPDTTPPVPDFAWCGPDSNDTTKPFAPVDRFSIGGDPEAYGSSKDAFDCTRSRRPFLLAQFPVTVAQYRLFVDAKGYENEAFWTPGGRDWLAGQARKEDVPDWYRAEFDQGAFPLRNPQSYAPAFQTPNHPQVGVSWFEARAYCQWLNATFTAELLGLPAGWRVALPTDAEWERAARQPDERFFPWGPQDSNEELNRRCNWHGTGLGQTSAVGLFPDGKSAGGAHDLAGNVWEWCQSRWVSVANAKEQAAYNQSRDLDDEVKSGERVLRGGSWAIINPDNLRVAIRGHLGPGDRSFYVGFRLVGVGESR